MLAKKDETVPIYIVTAQVPYVAKLQVTKLTVAICTDLNTCQLQVLQPAPYICKHRWMHNYRQLQPGSCYLAGGSSVTQMFSVKVDRLWCCSHRPAKQPAGMTKSAVFHKTKEDAFVMPRPADAW